VPREYNFATKKQLDKALHLYATTQLSTMEIGDICEMDQSRVCQLAKKHGLAMRGSSRPLSLKERTAQDRRRKVLERKPKPKALYSGLD
jgi:hypothetical protein